MNLKKKFLIILVIISAFFAFGYTNNFEVSAISGIEDQASNFIEKGKHADKSLSGDDIKNITGEFVTLGQLLTMIGAGIMVAATSYMGIKYIISPPDKQAALKQQLVGLVVSGIVIFGAYGIWNAILNVVKNFD